MRFNRYRRNASSYKDTYSTMSLGALQREERRLVETIDDYRYFKEDPRKIEALEEQLVVLRSVMSPEKMHYTPVADLPETAVQQQAILINDAIKTLKSLEKSSYDYENISQVASYRRTRSGLEETLEHIRPLQQAIVSGRKEVALAQNNLNQIQIDISTANKQLTELNQSLSKLTLNEQAPVIREIEELEAELQSLRMRAYNREQDISATNKKIQTALTIIYRDLAGVGYPVQTYTAPPSVRAEPQIMEVTRESAPISIPQELSGVYEAVSSDPAVAALQKQLQSAVQELTESMEDRAPAFVISKIQSRIASLHEEIERRTKKNRNRRYY